MQLGFNGFRKLALGMLIALPVARAASVTLGSFTFNSSEFGNTVTASDGGTFETTNWLNVVDSDPGLTGALTGANFNTGVANIGFSGSTIVFTIDYSTPIVNGPGADLAIVTGYSWMGDTYNIAVSTNGVTFTPYQSFPGATDGIDTGVNQSYYYGGDGPFATDLVVVPIDLSLFGIPNGGSVSAIEFEGLADTQPDLFRIAGLAASAATVPEPLPVGLTGLGFAALIALRRRWAH
jgi:hypothetical protein